MPPSEGFAILFLIYALNCENAAAPRLCSLPSLTGRSGHTPFLLDIFPRKEVGVKVFVLRS